MNKQKFIDYLRSPRSLTEGQLEDLNKSLTDFPYFSIGRSIAAKASKELSHESKGALTASAAIYSTDRKHLKKYINGELVFLIKVPTVAEEVIKEPKKSEKEAPSPPPSQPETVDAKKESHQLPPDVEVDPPAPNSAIAEKKSDVTTTSDDIPKITSGSDLNFDHLIAPSGEDVDQMLDELQRDMSELKKSREHFVDIQNQIEEEEAVSAALRRATEKVQDNPIEETKESESAKPEAIIKGSTELDEIKEPEVDQEKSEKPDEDDDLAALIPELKSEKPPIKKPEISGSSTTKRIKIKRSDLDKALSGTGGTLKKDSSTKKKEPSKSKPAEVEKSLVKKKENPPSTKAKIIKQKEVVKKPAGKTIAKKKEDEEVMKEVKKTEVAVSSKKEKVETKSKEKKTKPATKVIDTLASKQKTSKAFDSERSDTRTSVSKASPSKRKSSGSKGSSKAIKPVSKSTGDAKKGGKDDDESGGTNLLIDKFIKESPSIKRRPESDNTTDLSKSSTSWNPDIASEYLAQIYLDQGNTQRAITIYEALSLKFPEKKSYFAGLIQEIKK